MLDFFINNAWAEAAPQQGGSGGFLFMMIFFLALMYFLIMRPQMKQAKEHRQLLESLTKGDEVSVSGGLLGKIKEVGDNFILLEIAKDTEVKVQKNAVSAIMPKGTLKSL